MNDDVSHTLVVTTHHIACDQTSTPILLADLGDLYRAELGLGDPPQQLRTTYADYARWQRSQLSGEATDAAIAAWRARLGSYESELGPLVFSERQSERPPHEIECDLDEATGAGLIGLARAEATTPFVVTLACLKAAIQEVTDISDLVVAAVLSGRERSELGRLAGCFITTLPVRSVVEPGSPMRARVRVEREATLDAFDGRDIPFESVVGALNPVRLPGRTPYCDVILNFTETGRTSFDFGPVRAQRRLNQNIGTGTFDLSVERAGDLLQATITVDPSWVDVTEAERVAAAFVRLAGEAAHDPDA